jgi:hypothetical protein
MRNQGFRFHGERGRQEGCSAAPLYHTGQNDRQGARGTRRDFAVVYRMYGRAFKVKIGTVTF